MATGFDYQGAKNAGYSDEEIFSHLETLYPQFDAKSAQKAGYTPNEIAEYLSSQKPPQQGIRGQLERKVAAPVAEFGIRAGTAISDTAKGLGRLGVQGIGKLLEGMGIDASSLDPDQVVKIASMATPFGQLPSGDEISEMLKEATGGRLEPTTPGERILKKGAGIAGSVAGFGPGASLGSATKALGTAAMAGTTAALEEEGVNPWLALGGGIFADILTRSGSSLAKKGLGLAQKGIPGAAGILAGKASRLTPNEVKQQVIDAGKRLGIAQAELPLSAQLSSPAIQSIETKLRESSLSGRHLEKQLANVESKTKSAFDDIANQISTRQNLLPDAVSEEAISQLKNIEQNATNVYSDLYKQATRLLPETAVADARMGNIILKHIDHLVEQLGKGSGTPAKDTIRARLMRLSSDWNKRFSNGEIPIQELIDLKKDMNQIIKHEVRGGVDKMLNPLLNMSKNAIQKYGRTNQPFAFRFNEAERLFADSAQKFRKNKAVSSLLSTQNPQQILQKMRNVKTYRELKNLYGRTPEGKEAFADLSRYLLEDLLGKKITTKEGKIAWGHASGMMKDPRNREIVQEIVGKQNFDRLKDIRQVSAGIEEGLRKFANTSGTATKGLDIALILGTLGKGLGQLFSGQVIRGGRSMAYVLTPRIMAKLMADPKFIQALVDTAHAGRGSNPELFFEAAKRAAQFAVPAIIEANSAEDKENN